MTEHDRGEGSFRVDLRRADDLAAATREDVATAPPVVETPPAAAHRHTGPIVGVICLAIFASQLPSLRAAFQAPASIRIGAESTDEATEACIDTLWKISSALQFGSMRKEAALEPLTKQPYVVHQTGSDTVVACPNPGMHGLRSLQVSAAHRAPEAKE